MGKLFHRGENSFRAHLAVKNALQESSTGPHALSKSQAWKSKATKMARQVGEAAILTYLRKLKTFLS
ncbi:MAG: hypothetical protein SPL64_03370 [Bacteroidaceae bacterium]|nr:hypothetical protein [Bacteroidaceae bacterium]